MADQSMLVSVDSGGESLPLRISPDDDYQKEELPEKIEQRVVEVSSVPNLSSALAEATQENEHRVSTPDMSFVSLVREVSVESLMEMARTFLDSSQQQPEGIEEHSHSSTHSFGPIVENYYDMFEKKLNDETIKNLSKPELEIAIDALKDKILTLPPDKNQSERASMVQQLIFLRLKMQEIDDFNPRSSAGIFSLGHQFQRAPIFRHMSRRGRHCEVCGQLLIFTASQFDCSACGFSCHERCIGAIARFCVAEEVLSKPAYILEICPEKGLDAQNFACAECRKTFPINRDDVWETFIRLCDYDGKYYCTVCQRNDVGVSPARVVKNWDFSLRPLCRASKQMLEILASFPILNLAEINKNLSVQIEEIARVQEVRTRLAILQRMMLDCQEAPQIALLHRLPSGRKHFLTKSFFYSLNDLIDVEKEVLWKELSLFCEELEGHVRVTCPSCVKLSRLCAMCKKEGDRMYAFEERVTLCATCGASMHKACALQDPLCPNCRKVARAVTS